MFMQAGGERIVGVSFVMPRDDYDMHFAPTKRFVCRFETQLTALVGSA
jgi:hypothetical protein